ncbi:polysaccharide biosynthesis protein [Bacteroides sp. CAG:661]|nr:polysaccharide biosynthesis protein [Bacteroides sp. CAG:661]
MELDRKKNAFRGIIAGSLNKVIVMVLPFIMRTIILYYLGTQYLGLSSLFTSVLGLLSLAELGIGSAMIFSMYKPIAEDDTPTICALLKLYRKFYRIIGSIITIGGLCLLPFLDKVITGNVPSDINIYILYIIYLLNSTLTYFLFSYKNSLLDAHQRKDIDLNISSILTLTEYVIQIILILWTRNYYAYVIIFPIFTLIGNLIRAHIVSKIYPQYRCKGELDPQIKRDIYKKIGALSLHKIGNVFSSSSTNIIVSSLCGLTAVAIYGNYYYVSSCLVSILGIIFVSLTAGIGNKMVLESVSSNEQTFKNLNFINMWITICFASCLMSLYQPFMQIWVGAKGDDLFLPITAVIAFVYNFYIQQTRKVVCLFNDAAGIWKEDQFKPIIGAIVNITIGVILTKHYGIIGVILGFSVSLTLVEFPWETYVLFKHYFKKSSISYLKEFAIYTITAIACIAITYLTCSLCPETGYVSFIMKACIAIILPNILLFILFHHKTEFSYAYKNILLKLLRIK